MVVVNHNMIINSGLGEEPYISPKSVHDVVAKWGRRRHHDDSVRVEGLDDLRHDVLLVEQVLDQSNHEDAIKFLIKVQPVAIKIAHKKFLCGILLAELIH